RRRSRSSSPSSYQAARKRIRTFAPANGAYPESHFYIENTDAIEKLGTFLFERKFCLVCGHRQSGKSTIAFALKRWLYSCSWASDFAICYISFNSGVVFDEGVEKFWWSMLDSLRVADRNVFSFDNRKGIATSTAFKEFFSKTCSYPRKPTILIIDEASKMYDLGKNNVDVNTDKIINEFIATLRDLRDDRDQYWLYSVVLLGTESVREVLATRQRPGSSSLISPFSAEASFDTVRFTVNEIEDLLRQFSEENGFQLDLTEIAADIFHLTFGHKGLVGLCGFYLEYFVVNGKRSVSFDDWTKHTTVDLPIFVMGQATYYSIIRALRHLSVNQTKILGLVLRDGTHIAFRDDNDVKFLLAEGMVVIQKQLNIREVIIQCSAPLLRSMMLSHISGPRVDLAENVPDVNVLDAQWLLERTIENLSIQHIFSEQTANANSYPSDYAFQFEFITVFKCLLSRAHPHLLYRVLPEAKEFDEDGRWHQRLDILLRNGNQPAYGFELVVAASRTEFDKHCVRANEYGRNHSCSMYMVNLCANEKLAGYFGPRNVAITPVHVILDVKRGVAHLVFENEKKSVSIKGGAWQVVFE
ncbi:8917_t:CDS:2, partial [Paraglomus occultum]